MPDGSYCVELEELIGLPALDVGSTFANPDDSVSEWDDPTADAALG